MFLIILLPLAFYGIYEKLHQKCNSCSTSLAGSLLIYEGIVLLLANLLSIGSHLNAATASVAWLLIVLVLYSFPRPDDEKGLILPLLKDRWSRVRKFFSTLPNRCSAFLHGCNPMEKILLALCCLLCLILLFLALLTPPSNYDSMTYHLARVAHWIDNGSVNYYLTNIDRQLFSPVLSEYNLLFMMLLSGTDALLAMQQYLGMLLTAYFLFQILRRIGTSRVFSLFGVFMYLSMPLTISQAITTQNDLGALLWYAIFLYYLLDFLAIPRLDAFRPQTIGQKSSAGNRPAIRSCETDMSLPILMICIGSSVGFAFLMKTSVCASMVMFMPWVLIVCIKRRDDILSLLLSGVTAVLSMCVVISETLLRTYFATGSLMSSATSGDIMVATKNVKYIIVNLLKNYCLLITQHFWTALNGFIYRIPISLGRVLSVEVNNIAISFHGFDFITYLNTGDDMYSHDRTSSAFAAYLALIGGVLLIIMLIRKLIHMIRQQRLQNAAAIESSNSDKNMQDTTNKKNNESDAATHFCDPSWGFVISAWLGFGFIMALLRWQPWGSRLMYPALTIAAVSAVHMLDHCFSLSSSEAAEKNEKRNQPAGIKTGTFVILLIMTALSSLLLIRPLMYNGKLAAAYISSGFDAAKKEELFFDGHKHAYPAYMELVTQLEKTNPKDIALIISGDGYDYPLWKMVRDRLPEARIRHIKADIQQGAVLHAGDYSNPSTGISDTSSAKTGTAGTKIDRPADCIVCIESGGLQEGMTLDYNGIVYSCGFVADEPEVPAGIFYYDTQKNGQSKETLSAP